MEIQEEKESTFLGKIQWLFFVVFIPLLFAIAVTLVVLNIAGVDVEGAVKKYGAHVPGVSKLVADKNTINIEDKLRKDIGDLEATNKEQIDQISSLEKEIEQRDKELDQLKSKIDELTEQLNDEESEQANSTQTKKEISKAFESMSAKNAAAIVAEMQASEALKILQALSTDTLSSILEKMDPVEAAKYTELLSNSL
ncbi:MotE family protein [Bacillus suaedaesalsae]|uniref:Magnesium transporter MgtE intracellular domain-containing protein n=1 Tax=Bacillus suaedaesalsae TaxID=2810349 RepID=A0ABS2DJ00_9BACI|nr:hypothetical protein [Bacillus suaedaesalsae]MBM6618443.1 hypothetical protein [Bacillus suaedaesalsae]